MVDVILGFALLRDIPANAELQRLEPNSVEDSEPGCDVYEVAWEGRGTGGPAPLYSVQVFLDPGKQRPIKTELRCRASKDDEWHLETTTLFAYPSRQEVDRTIDDGPVAR